MSAPETEPVEAPAKQGFSGPQVAGIVLVTVLLTAVLGWWLITRYVFPDQLQPVELSQTEESELQRKLATLGVQAARQAGGYAAAGRGGAGALQRSRRQPGRRIDRT